MKNTYILIFSLAIFCLTCEYDTNIPLPAHKSKLVAYAMLHEGKNPKIFLGRSFGLNTQIGRERILVKNAKVEFIENDQVVGELLYEEHIRKDTNTRGEISNRLEGMYTANNLLVIGKKTYGIKISHPGYETISAQTTVAKLPTVSNIRIEQNVAIKRFAGDFIQSQSLIHLTINMPEGAASSGNYYQVGLENTEEFVRPSNTVFRKRWYLAEGIAIRDINAYKADTPWFSGKGKEGKSIDITFLIDLRTFNSGVFEKELIDAHLVLFSVNEEGKKFIDTFKRHYDTEGAANGVSGFPPEAVIVFSNIENGYGLMGEISQVVHKVE